MSKIILGLLICAGIGFVAAAYHENKNGGGRFGW